MVRSAAMAFLAACAFVGCFGPPSDPNEDVEPIGDGAPAVIPAADEARPGIYDLSADGLVELETLPGLTWIDTAGGRAYSYDVRENLRENADTLVLVQGLDDQIVEASYDIDIPLHSDISERPGSDIICLGVGYYNGWAEHGFYFERAAGRAGIAPDPDPAPQGGLMAHGMAGPIDALVEVFGNRFTEEDSMTFRIHEGGFLRLDNGLSQYPPEATYGDDNHWWQNFTLPGEHRIIRIPESPLFCARGFAEFDGVQIVGRAPFEFAEGGKKSIETLYGTFVNLNQQAPGSAQPPDVNPVNSARVDYLGEACRAGPGTGVHRSGFGAGFLSVEVERWHGHPWVILSGMAAGQAPWALPLFEESCPS